MKTRRMRWQLTREEKLHVGEGVAEGALMEVPCRILKKPQEVEVQVPWKAGVRGKPKTGSIFEKSVEGAMRSQLIHFQPWSWSCLLTLCWTRQDSFCLRVGIGFPRESRGVLPWALRAPLILITHSSSLHKLHSLGKIWRCWHLAGSVKKLPKSPTEAYPVTGPPHRDLSTDITTVLTMSTEPQGSVNFYGQLPELRNDWEQKHPNHRENRNSGEIEKNVANDSRVRCLDRAVYIYAQYQGLPW